MADDMKIVVEMVDKVSGDLEKIEKGTQSLGKAFKKSAVEINAQLEIIKKGLQGVKKAFAFIEFGAKIKQQEEAFRNLAQSVGESSSELVSNIRRASGDTLSNLEVIENASKAIILGLDPSKLGKLMEISRASARAFGTDAGFMFDSITMGIGRQSKMILDNLGIIVSAEEAYRKYAESLGLTSKDLDEAQKKQAFLNEVLEQGEKIIENVGTSSETNFESVQKITKALSDAAGAMAKLLINLPGVGSGLKGLGDGARTSADHLDALATTFDERETLKAYAAEILLIDTRLESLRSKIGSGFNIESNMDTFNELLDLRNEKQLEYIKLQDELNSKQMFLNDQLAVQNMHSKSFADSLEKAEEREESIGARAKQLEKQLNRAFSDPFSDFISGTKTAQEAITALGKNLVGIVADYIAQWVIAHTIGRALAKIALIGATAEAAALTAIWTPPAILAATATLGGAAVAGGAAIGTAMGASLVASQAMMAAGATAGATPLAEGGIVTKPTFALIGEAGPEAVVPLSGDQGGMGNTFNISIDRPNFQDEDQLEEIMERIGFEADATSRTARAF